MALSYVHGHVCLHMYMYVHYPSPPTGRHSTLAVTTETHRIKAKNRTLPSGKPHLKGTRPLSDASLNLLDTYDVRRLYMYHCLDMLYMYIHVLPEAAHFFFENDCFG